MSFKCTCQGGVTQAPLYTITRAYHAWVIVASWPHDEARNDDDLLTEVDETMDLSVTSGAWSCTDGSRATPAYFCRPPRWDKGSSGLSLKRFRRYCLCAIVSVTTSSLLSRASLKWQIVSNVLLPGPPRPSSAKGFRVVSLSKSAACTIVGRPQNVANDHGTGCPARCSF